MDMSDIILIGVALSMDAFALTIANCAAYRGKLTPLKEWSMPIAFALFQTIMPIVGFYVGSAVAGYISSAAGYVTAAVFFLLALKVVIDNLRKKDPADETPPEDFSLGVLTVQAVATSIDALVIGVTFAATLTSPFLPALAIGGVTFALVAAALLFGKYLGELFGKYAEWFGAAILFILAVKTLVFAIIGK